MTILKACWRATTRRRAEKGKGKRYEELVLRLPSAPSQDVGRGRLIPKYPWESLLFPVSEWMGVSPEDQKTIFPNLENFNSSYILPTSTLFD